MFSGPERRWHWFSPPSSLNKVFSLKWMQLRPDLLSVTPGSPPRLLFVGKVRDSVCSQDVINRKEVAAVTGPPHHQGSLLELAGVFWSVVASELCYSTHTHTHPTYLSYYCRVCSCLPVLLTPLDGLPSCQLLPPNTNTKTGIVWAGWSILFKI